MNGTKLLDIDQKIWGEELDAFVPKRIFDIHSHIFVASHCLQALDSQLLRPEWLDEKFSRVDIAFLQSCSASLLPGRKVDYLLMGYPFIHCDFDHMNTYVADESRRNPKSPALMVVHPKMTVKNVVKMVERYGFIGFKPYRFYTTTGNPVECCITDMLPEPLIEVADDRKLLVMLHLSRRAAIAEPENISEIIRLTQRYKNVRWILAHCARSFNPCFLEKGLREIRDIPNIWYDTSVICESDVFNVLLSEIPIERILYGSDNPAGLERGKYIAFGHAWALLKDNNHSFDLSHCDSRTTFVLYEELRALRRSILQLKLSESQVEDLFCNNAIQLLGRNLSTA